MPATTWSPSIPARPSPPAAASRSARRRCIELARRARPAVRTPKTLKTEEEAAAFKALDLDAAVVVSYGHILPKASSTRRCWAASTSTARCCRAGAARRRSIARSWRATPRPASPPCAWTKGLDTGPMLLAERTPISAADTAETVHDRLAELGATADRVDARRADAPGRIEPVPQPERGRHLRPQARQGGRRARLAAARGRARAQGARLPSLARHVVRRATARRIKVLAAALALAGGAPGTVSVGARRLSGRGLRHRRAAGS